MPRSLCVNSQINRMGNKQVQKVRVNVDAGGISRLRRLCMRRD